MKKLIYFLLGGTLALVSLQSCENNMSVPTYNDTLIYFYNVIDQQIGNLYNDIYDQNKTWEQINNQIDMLMSLNKDFSPRIKKIKKIKEDKVGFYESICEFIESSNEIIVKEIKPYILKLETDQNLTDEDYNLIEKQISESFNKIQLLEKKVIETQEKFAKENNLTLQ